MPADGEYVARAAYERLLEAEYAFVYRFILWLHPNRTEAEDLTQETFFRAWRKIATRRSGVESDRAWVAAIARRVTLDYRRRRGVATESLEKVCDMPDLKPPLPDQLVAAEETRRLTRALLAMPEPYRTALVLTQIEEMTTKAAARAMGAPQGTVKWRVARGLYLLREPMDAGQATNLPEVRNVETAVESQ